MNENFKVLIAYDGSEYADNAIDELAKAGLPRNAQASIIYVRERWMPIPRLTKELDGSVVSTKTTAARMARADEDLEIVISEEQSQRIEQAKLRLQNYFPDWKIYTNILRGSPSREIVVWAVNSKADLVVVGCQGRSKSKINVFGSVSQKIANETPCSVRIVRGRTWKLGSPNRILIGLDGSEAATKAVREVASRMWLPGSEVRLVLAKDKPDEDVPAEIVNECDLWINNQLAVAKKILEQTELKISEVIEEEDPKQLIVSAADEWGADCIFVGANNDLNYFENLLLGSVSTAVAIRSHCTVEIVR